MHHAIAVDYEIAQAMFAECGVVLENKAGLGCADITEDDPRWPCVSAALARYEAVRDALRGFSLRQRIDSKLPPASPRVPYTIGDRVWTDFTEAERKLAPFLEIGAWHHGYPQPEDILGYRQATFDLSNACGICHSGAKQIAPFRMKQSPAWGRRSMLQLNWVFDEIFVKPDVYEAVFHAFGVGRRPVVLHRTGAEMDTVVQLAIEPVAEVQADGIPFGICEACGQRNYHRSPRGFAPRPAPTEAPLFKSAQKFHAFEARVYVSQALYRKLAGAKLKGAEFRPCRSD